VKAEFLDFRNSLWPILKRALWLLALVLVLKLLSLLLHGDLGLNSGPDILDAGFQFLPYGLIFVLLFAGLRIYSKSVFLRKIRKNRKAGDLEGSTGFDVYNIWKSQM
tara:strand:+ start:1862 stop:2182 length:321 start_codon:yes stop_codon:yes gene_type:complete